MKALRLAVLLTAISLPAYATVFDDACKTIATQLEKGYGKEKVFCLPADDTDPKTGKISGSLAIQFLEPVLSNEESKNKTAVAILKIVTPQIQKIESENNTVDGVNFTDTSLYLKHQAYYILSTDLKEIYSIQEASKTPDDQIGSQLLAKSQFFSYKK